MAALRVASVGRTHIRRLHAAPAPLAAAISSSNSEVPARPTILVAEKLAQSCLKALQNAATVDCSYNLSPADLIAKMSFCDALIVGSDTMVTRQLLEASKGRLKVVGKAGAGLLNVDVQAATELGCLVVNAATQNPDSAAQHVMNILQGLPHTFHHLFVAIMGWGKVGYTLAELANRKWSRTIVMVKDCYGCLDDGGWRVDSFGQQLDRVDVISLHIPLTTATKKAFNAEILAKVKDGVRIISDGDGVIDEEALLEALDSGAVAQVVFTEEPSKLDNKLASHKNVTVMPHPRAGTTMLAQEGIATEIAKEVLSALQGDIPLSAVNARAVHKWVFEYLAPYMPLAEKLGRLMQLAAVGRSVKVSYRSNQCDQLEDYRLNQCDLQKHLLRPMIIKGLVESISGTNINFVNADYVAKQHGLVITEECLVITEECPLCEKWGVIEGPVKSIQVKIAQVESKFAIAQLADLGEIAFEGKLKPAGTPCLSKVGSFDVDISLDGRLIFLDHVDQPGMIGEVTSVLGEENVNINFVSVARKTSCKQAVMAIGVDDEPSTVALERIKRIPAVKGLMFLNL